LSDARDFSVEAKTAARAHLGMSASEPNGATGYAARYEFYQVALIFDSGRAEGETCALDEIESLRLENAGLRSLLDNAQRTLDADASYIKHIERELVASHEHGAVTRITVVDQEHGRLFERYNVWSNGVRLDLQDEGRTLKVFPA
jgi:hypothetical protein